MWQERDDTQELYYLLDQAMLEAEYLKQETLEESHKRRAAEKIALNAIRRVILSCCPSTWVVSVSFITTN